MNSNVVLSTQEYNVVGSRPIRHDGTDKVTGRAQYGADINLPGLLHGKILRSPHAHARIKVHRYQPGTGPAWSEGRGDLGGATQALRISGRRA